MLSTFVIELRNQRGGRNVMRDVNNFIVFVLRDLRTANGTLLIGETLADHL